MELLVEEQEEEETLMELDAAGDRAAIPGGGAQEAERTGGEGPRKRGVKPGSKRGPYRKRCEGAKERIIESYRRGENWKVTATANGVAVKTAYGYITRPDNEPTRPRGGETHRKVAPAHVEKLVEYVEENPQLSLKEMARRLEEDTGLHLSIPTVHRYLHGKLYTVKKVMPQPERMNTDENKRKRAEYTRHVTEAVGAGKTAIYIDETNINLFLRRTEGRSLKGTRCSVKAATARGPNVHLIGAMTQTGLVYWSPSEKKIVRNGSERSSDGVPSRARSSLLYVTALQYTQPSSKSLKRTSSLESLCSGLRPTARRSTRLSTSGQQ